MARGKILVIDDEKMVLSFCKRALTKEGYRVKAFLNGLNALKSLSNGFFDIVLADLKMPHIGGIEILKKIKEVSPCTEVIIMTGFGTIDSAVEVTKLGAFDYITKPFDIDTLRLRVRRCLDNHKMKEEISELKDVVNLHKVSMAMSSSMELEKLLKHILEIACKTLEADHGSIMLYEDKTNSLKVAAFHGKQIDSTECTRLKIGEGISGWVAKMNEPMLLINGLRNYPQFRTMVTRPEIKSAMVMPLTAKGKLIGVINLSRTISEINFTKKDLRMLTIFATNISLAIHDSMVYEELRRLDKMKTEFVSNISHELRTPLMVAQSSLELLLNKNNKGINKTSRKLLDIGYRNTKRISNMIGELLDFARFKGKDFELKKTSFDLVLAIKEITEELGVIAQQKGIKIISKSVPVKLSIKGDREGIKMVLRNLVDNSIKFTPEGGTIDIEMDCTKSMSRGSDGEFATVSVKDNGIGIAPEFHERVFDDFYQVDGSTTRKYRGIGLGLAISRKIIEAHKGRIWVESEQGKGSKFIFNLPLE